MGESIGENMQPRFWQEVKRAIAGSDACITKSFATILAGGHILD